MNTSFLDLPIILCSDRKRVFKKLDTLLSIGNRVGRHKSYYSHVQHNNILVNDGGPRSLKYYNNIILL
jgi:hypothetical protein